MSRLAGLFLKEPGSEDAAAQTRTPYTILFVDDEPQVVKSLVRIFRRENYEILTASNAAEALGLFDRNKIHLVVSDHRMPGMSGAELLRKIKAQSPDTIRIMLTGHADVNAVMGAVNEGAVYKFITKPWNPDDLRITVGLALEQYDLIQENRKLRKEAKVKESEVKRLQKLASTNRTQIDRYLLKRGKLSLVELEKAQKAQSLSGETLSHILIRMELADEDSIFKAVMEELKPETVSLPEWRVSREVQCLLPRNLCEKAGVLPLRLDKKRLTVAMVDPTDFAKIDELSFVTGFEVQPVLVRHSDLAAKLEELYGKSDELTNVEDLVAEYDPLDAIEVVIEEDEEEDVESLLRAKDQPPAIRIVNAVIAEAVRLDASDVHIEPRTKHISVRYRIDGMLVDKIQVPLSFHLPLLSRLKILADLDIAERRRPQDGRITVKTARKIVDLRISTLPTIRGEKAVLRILDRSASVKRLADLGVGEKNEARLNHLARMPQGIILATGPTGSGKTTTLYALLAEAYDSAKNYVTIEDPVEYHMEQAGQVYVKEKIGLDFAAVLRSVLRQDPDVILLGEIRDIETAKVAFHAALTGHLVLSTLHTNSAAATIVRLRDLGMEASVITSAMKAIVAQRLVRRLCSNCKIIADADPALLHALGADDFADDFGDGKAHAAVGCDKCNGTGYSGRLPLLEIMEMVDPLREVIRAGAGERDIWREAKSFGFRTLLDDAIEKAKKGLTSLDELYRVLGPGKETTRQCPACKTSMELHHKACPSCGAWLRSVCQKCGEEIESKWSFCVRCAAPLPKSPDEPRDSRKEKT